MGRNNSANAFELLSGKQEQRAPNIRSSGGDWKINMVWDLASEMQWVYCEERGWGEMLSAMGEGKLRISEEQNISFML